MDETTRKHLIPRTWRCGLAADARRVVEQEVARVDHAHTVDQLVAVGRDTEALVLARAVTWHLEHRVILNGAKTVVFR